MKFKIVRPVLLAVASLLLIASLARAADPPAAATSQPAATAASTDISVFQLFIKGGFFMYPLALCSVIAIAIIFERFIALRRGQVLPGDFLPGLRNVFKDPAEDRETALAYCKSHDSPLSRVLAAGIRRLPRGWTAAEKSMEDEGANQAMRLRHNMRFLYSLGSVATLLGLIGTISGMIKAFQVAAVAGVGRVDQLSTGIYEAMTCTFGGLAVAIVVTVFYYFLVGRIERLVTELNDTVNHFADAYGANEEAKSTETDRELTAA
jgi:biopolymer transport protein ExbB